MTFFGQNLLIGIFYRKLDGEVPVRVTGGEFMSRPGICQSEGHRHLLARLGPGGLTFT